MAWRGRTCKEGKEAARGLDPGRSESRVEQVIRNEMGHGESAVRFWTAADGMHPFMCKRI